MEETRNEDKTNFEKELYEKEETIASIKVEYEKLVKINKESYKNEVSNLDSQF